MADDKMTRKDVAEEYKLPTRTVDYLVATKQIPFSRIGKRNVRFSRNRLEQWFSEREHVEYHRPEARSESKFTKGIEHR